MIAIYVSIEDLFRSISLQISHLEARGKIRIKFLKILMKIKRIIFLKRW